MKNILSKVSEFVPGGIVVFFPSYKYEKWFFEQLQGIKFSKPIFREPQNSGSVETILASYAAVIRKNNSGAILFSVVGKSKIIIITLHFFKFYSF